MECREPKFRVEGTSRNDARLFLQCSTCEADIREIRPHESIRVDRAYYCPACTPGANVIALNPPHVPPEDGEK